MIMPYLRMPPEPKPQATSTKGQPSWMAPVMPSVSDHELLRRIGGGSYGAVWLARTTVGTWRAVKVVFRDRFTDARPYEREFKGIQKFEPLSRSNEGFIDILQIGGRGGTQQTADKPWTTRRSMDGGNTWTTVDSFQMAPGKACWPKAAVIDQRGHLYGAGHAEVPSDFWVSEWIVRRSTGGGQSWETVDALSNSSGLATAEAMTVDASGNVFVAGRTSAGWLVRVSTDGGNTWSDSEEFVYPSGQGQNVHSLAADADGNVFAIGRATDAAGSGHCVIRKLDSPPRLTTGLSHGSLEIKWSTNAAGFILQSATTLVNGGDWQDSNLTPTVVGDQNAITIGTTTAAALFRLHKP